MRTEQGGLAADRSGLEAAELVLSAVRVSKSYRKRQALADVSIDVQRGEFVVLLGPNGAGKSTLLQVLTGLFNPGSGSVMIGGRDLRRDPAGALASVGVVFQQPTLDLELSVMANLRFHADLHNVGRQEAARRIADLLTRFGLTERASESARSLSGGNRRRLELARSLLHRPKLLLMDEPTVGLDPASRSDLIRTVRSLCKDGQVGVLWTTHLIDEAEQADRILLLHEGRLRFSGTPSQLMHATGTSALADAFGSLTSSGGGEPPEG